MALLHFQERVQEMNEVLRLKATFMGHFLKHCVSVRACLDIAPAELGPEQLLYFLNGKKS